MEFNEKQKGQLEILSGAALAVVVLAIVLVVGFKILGTMGDSLTANTYEKNATNSILSAMNTNFVGFIPVVIIALVAGVILFIIFKFLRPGQSGGL